MKITTITRNTSVSGVMLMSANKLSPTAPPPSSSSSPESGCFPIAIVIALRALVVGLVLLRLDPAVVRVGPLRLLARSVPGLFAQELEEFVGEELHLGRDPVRTLAEEVVHHDRGNGD